VEAGCGGGDDGGGGDAGGVRGGTESAVVFRSE
jgi:hypothetical protein